MKQIKYIVLSAFITLLVSCSDLDLAPKDGIANETWYKDREMFEMNLNAMLLHQFWPQERNEFTEGGNIFNMDEGTDDWSNRNTSTVFTNGTLSSDNSTTVSQMWNFTYMGISRCNTILNELELSKDLLSKDDYNFIRDNARFYRACFYSRLIMLFGDTFVWEKLPALSEMYDIERTDRFEVLEYIYREFDTVAETLPVKYEGSQITRATKGQAYAMKARVALHFASLLTYDTELKDAVKAARHFGIARDAAKACINLNAYTLHPDFGDLFLNRTKSSSEGILILARSKQYSSGVRKQYLNGGAVTGKLPRLANSGVGATATPTWDLLCSFLCNDGLPIDESPKYDPKNPFANRDPRCTYTIVEFGSRHLGLDYQPRFDVKQVMNYTTGEMVSNTDNRAVQQYASYNGLILRKAIDEDWLGPFFEAENDKLVIRYADVLLMYAEAKIELDEIDRSALDAMNQVRARAYKADYMSDDYPKVEAVGTDKAALLQTLRTERRMEFAYEGLRIYDLMRWRIAEKVINAVDWGVPLAAADQNAILNDGMWFIGSTPQIDEFGCPEMETLSALTKSHYVKLRTRVFDTSKQYLWPIPADELLILSNPNQQNPGY